MITEAERAWIANPRDRQRWYTASGLALLLATRRRAAGRPIPDHDELVADLQPILATYPSRPAGNGRVEYRIGPPVGFKEKARLQLHTRIRRAATELLDRVPAGRYHIRDLYGQYLRLCRLAGEEPAGIVAFTATLRQVGHPRLRIDETRHGAYHISDTPTVGS